MGLAVDNRRIAIGTRKQIHFLVPANAASLRSSDYLRFERQRCLVECQLPNGERICDVELALSGSTMMDCFLSSESLEATDSQTQYTELLIKLLSLGIDYERPVLRNAAKIREQLGLPIDRNLYACPQTLFWWWE